MNSVEKAQAALAAVFTAAVVIAVGYGAAALTDHAQRMNSNYHACEAHADGGS